jgi:hypothetical protein
MISKAEILEKVLNFVEGWDFGDDEIQREADEIKALVEAWQTEGMAAGEEVE